MELNPSQLQAVNHESGPLLIVAGAGTGKTTVLTERIKFLILEKKVDPYHIFVTTFTEKAATELETRLDQVMPFGYHQPWLGTFHSICERILRLEGLDIGLSPNFTIMTQTDQWLFIKDHLYDFDLHYYRPLGNPTKFIAGLITFFSRINDEDNHPDEFSQAIAAQADPTEASRLTELFAAYTTYQRLKAADKKVDFGDLITHTLTLFRTRPNVLSRYQRQFEHLLVDEFQDTNKAQFELIQLLAPPAIRPNLVVVGDDNQSIYKFRGASVSNILQFKDLYPDAQSVVLNDNYRSTQPILDGAYQSIQHNDPDTLEAKLHISKQLQSHLDSPVVPQILSFPTGVDEAIWTTNQIHRLVVDQGLAYKDIVILARANSQLDPYPPLLKLAGIPFQRVANSGLFDQEEVAFLVNLLKVVVDPHDSMELFNLAQHPTWQLEGPWLLDQISKANHSTQSLWDILTTKPTAELLISTINSLRDRAATVPVSQLLHGYIESTHYLADWIKEDSVESILKIKNINLFFNQLRRFEQTTAHPTAAQFLELYQDWSEAGENPGQAQIEDVDAVSLMTVHASKGLEFSAVFLCSLLAGRFPSNDRKDKIIVPDQLVKAIVPEGDAHLQEERRLFYVALTRAKQFLYLTYAPDMGGAKKWRASGFIAETGLPVQTMTPEPAALTPASPPKIIYLHQGKYSIDKTSYSQLDTFQSCPLQYKFRYLLHIPTPDSASVSYGNTIHQTLQTLHQSDLAGTPLSLDSIKQEYIHNFSDAGFTDKSHRDQRFATGLTALESYYQQKNSLFGTPYLLEQKFSIQLDAGLITGKIDRIDQLPDGSFGILDYKTGDPKTQDKVDKDEQLSVYALAARDVFHLNITKLGLYFFDHGQLITTHRSDSQIDKIKQKIDTRINEMRASTFPAKPDPVKCGWCPFYSICPYASKKRQN